MASTEEETMRQIRQELASAGATLTEDEEEWKAKGSLLESRGYRLRPRYHEGWTPSWTGRDVKLQRCEDWHRLPVRAFVFGFSCTTDPGLERTSHRCDTRCRRSHGVH